jgi:hypothetical protein
MNIQELIHQAMLRQAAQGEDAWLEEAYEDQHGYPEEDEPYDD